MRRIASIFLLMTAFASILSASDTERTRKAASDVPRGIAATIKPDGSINAADRYQIAGNYRFTGTSTGDGAAGRLLLMKAGD